MIVLFFRLVRFIGGRIFLVMAGLFVSGSSQAVLTENLTIGSPKALALGNAVTADPPGLDSTHYNPAGLVHLNGRQLHAKLLFGSFAIQLNFDDNTPTREATLARWQKQTQLPASAFVDVANQSRSDSAGASIMLPFLGMTDMPVALAPLGGLSYSPAKDRLTFAVNTYAPLALGFYRKPNDPGIYIGERLGFSFLTMFAPSIALRLTDTLTIGTTLTLNYAGMGLDLHLREPNELFGYLDEVANQEVCAGKPGKLSDLLIDGYIQIGELINFCDSRVGPYDELGFIRLEVEQKFTWGLNFGLLWEPEPWLSVGMVYQAPVVMDMKGHYRYQNQPAWQGFLDAVVSSEFFNFNLLFTDALGLPSPKGHPESKGWAKLKLEMPEHFAVGLSVRLFPRVKLNMDYKFTGWSKWQGIPLEFENQIDFMAMASYVVPEYAQARGLNLPLNLRDTWNLAVGLEYQYNDRLLLRFGLEDRPSSVPDSARTPLVPIASSILYATGFEYQLNRHSQLAFGAGFLQAKQRIPGNTSQLGNLENPAEPIYNPYAGRNIRTSLTGLVMSLGYSQFF